MKKNISINISGIIFHIEEDGYELLRKYLDSVNRYFASFEDSAEILADIEGRIAEIFLSKLSESKQIITAEDVNNLMSIMGSVNDFKAAEQSEATSEQAQSEPRNYTKQNQGYQSTAGKSQQSQSGSKRLFRDSKRKILGGVCSGLANYFQVDAVWVRLIFALLIFAYGTAFIAYIILWIAVPNSDDLDEPIDTKKMYRDPENKVLGGVASGVAAYFGTDVAIVRILFLVGAFVFGTGFLLYFILWVVLPEAKTITERMQMQGEPVTLSNIESNIKKNIQDENSKEESALTKIILLPFRALGAIFQFIGRLLVPIAEIVRVMAGILFGIIAISFLIAIVVGGGVLLGLFSSVPDWLQIGFRSDVSFPIQAFLNSFSPVTIIAAFVASIIPVLFLLLLSISIIAKRYVFGSVLGWTFFGLWITATIILGIAIPRIAYGFRESAEVKKELIFSPAGKTPILRIKPAGMEDYDEVSLFLEGYEGNNFKLVQKFKSQGTSQQDALINAEMVTYNVELQDSVLIFDSNVNFKKDAVFRGQELDMILYIPFNKPFILETSAARFIQQYIDWDNLDSKTWQMTEQGLSCLNCEGSYVDNLSQNWSFDKVDITGFADVTIQEGDIYRVEIVGEADEKSHYVVEQEGKTLVVKYKKFDGDINIDWSKNLFKEDEVEIKIIMPNLEEVEAAGAGKIKIGRFTSDDLTINLSGALKCSANLTSHNLNVNLVGASELELSGDGNNLEAKLAGASKLKAYDYQTQDAIVEVVGVSNARVFVTESIEIHETVGSKVSYRGNPTEIKKNK